MSESEAARWEMASLEGEIRSVKALLRELGPPTSTPAAAAAASASPGGATATGGEGAAPRQDGDGSGAGDDSAPGADSSSGGAGAQPAPASATTNSLTVAWMSTSAAEPEFGTLTLELSSPVEQAALQGPGESYTFRGVETGQATLTVAATASHPGETGEEAQKTTGTSLHDLAPLLKFDAMDLDQKSVETTVTAELTVDKEEEEEGEGKEEGVEEVSLDDDPGASKEAAPPKEAPSSLGTVTLRLTFCPSTQDRREELYEILNKATQRRAAAVERLRSAAVAEQRRIYQQQMQQSQSEPSGSESRAVSRAPPGGSSPAVRSGFLNKPRASDVPAGKPWWSRVRASYDRYLGPQSLARQVFPVARNYVTFAVAVYLMHYRGQLLALPAPV